MLMVCQRMLCRTGVFSGDAGTRRQITAYHGATQAISSTWSALPWQNCAAVMGCSCRWDKKVTTCSRTEVATSRIGRDWLAVIREVFWRQVVRTLEHYQTQFKLDTLVDWLRHIVCVSKHT